MDKNSQNKETATQPDTAAESKFIGERELFSWKSDPLLRKVGSLLTRQRNAVLSLDFFDTLVCRLSNHPADVFTVLASKLSAQECLCAPFSPTAFREIRKAAEAKARQKAFWRIGTTEVSIRDIYEELHPEVVTDIAKAIATEIETEIDFCFINPQVESLLHYAVSLGHRVCILSDMYLSSSDLRRIAQGCGMDTSQISLIATSSEHGKGKTSGYLYQYAMAQLQISRNQFFHLGDNEDADVIGAQKSDVQGFHYAPSDDTVSRIFLEESRFYQGSRFPLGHNAIRTLAIQSDAVHSCPHTYAGCFTLGPLLTHWSDWCVDELHRKGIKQVFALMREGRLLATMLRNSARAMNIELNVEELFVSRQSTHLASVGAATSDTIADRIYARTVGEIFAGFGMNAESLGFPKQTANRPVQSVEMLQTLVKFFSSGQLKAQVEQNSAVARRAFMDYFLPKLTEKRIALVDLGWAATIQRNITRILEIEGVQVECHGLYLSTSSAAAHVLKQRTQVQGYLSDFGDQPLLTDTLTRSPEIIEQTVSAPLGSTLSYEKINGVMTPVLETVQVSDEEQQNRTAVQHGILRYQKTWLHIATRKQLFSSEHKSASMYQLGKDNLRCCSRSLIHRLIGYPTKEEAHTLGGFHHDDGLHTNSMHPVAAASKRAILERFGYGEMMKSPKAYWPQGVLALSDATAIRHLAVGTQFHQSIKDLGKIHSVETLYKRHLSLTSDDITDIRIDADDWLYYSIYIRCPKCGNDYQTKTTGTYTVIVPVGCPHCEEVYNLTYSAVQEFFQRNHPQLLDANITSLEKAVNTLREELNLSNSGHPDLPVLATISNAYTANSISKTVVEMMTKQREKK